MITYIPAREWIASRKQKPEDGKEVLGVIRFADNPPYIEVVVYDSRDKIWGTADSHDDVRVSYWCELPKLPYPDRSRKSKKQAGGSTSAEVKA